MTTFDYILDSALVLLVLIQIRERPMSARPLIRPLVILGIAVLNYLHGIPTQGNDLLLLAVFALVGASIGAASGLTVIFRRHADGLVTFRSGWLSGFFWVLGMGSRFIFIYWITHSGASAIARFTVNHSISGPEAWTVALLGMAVFEVLSRTAIMAMRWQQLEAPLVLEAA
ncbi:MAG TPA: hypothetical protein VME01_02280 [Solirubrobacteraceae bacterium]|nr:hypothetical protein [Solirubrobacteraceae bacterium]